MKIDGIWKMAWRTAWPAVLESFFIALAGMIDMMMVASLGTYAVASVGLTTQAKFIGLTFFIAINVALSAFIARRKGEGNKKLANEYLITAFFLTLSACLFISLICYYFAPIIIKYSGSKQETHSFAVEYFRIIMGFMFFNIVSMLINAAQRGSGNTRIAFTTNLVSSLVNIIFNYILIGGKFGFPALGVRGAAIATVMGTVVAFFMSLRSLFKKDSFVQIPYIINKKIKGSKILAKKILKLAANIFIENIAKRLGFLITALMAASLGTDDFAVHQAGMNVLSLSFAFADGMQVSAVALTGSSLGKGDKEKARKYGKTCQKIGLIISVGMSIFLFIFGKDIFSLFFKESANIVKGIMISRFIMVITLFQISQIIYGGCLRSAGDVKYALFASMTSVTIIRSLVTMILVGVLKMGLFGIWIGVLSDQFSRYMFMSTRFRKGKWVDIKI